MTREQSWEVDGEALRLLRRIAASGYVVSAHRIPPSLLGPSGAFVEMHAVDVAADPPVQQLARIALDDGGDVDLRCARLLAEAVGVDHLGN